MLRTILPLLTCFCFLAMFSCSDAPTAAESKPSTSENSDADNQEIDFGPLVKYSRPIKANKRSRTQTYKIRYDSDGNEIEGFISHPYGKENLPVLIYARSGVGNHGALNFESLKTLEALASRGVLVMASQLRGNIHSEGKDEIGGEDLNDIMQLIKIAKSINIADATKVAIMGSGRGAMNALQIAKKTEDITTVIVTNPMIDPRLEFEDVKNMEETYSQVIGKPNIEKRAYDERSPILWTDQIKAPVLIFHQSKSKGDENDNRSKELADKLEETGNDVLYKFMHMIPENQQTIGKERSELMQAWLTKYLGIPEPQKKGKGKGKRPNLPARKNIKPSGN